MISVSRAVIEADKLRTKQGFTMFQPVNVFDICLSMGISVRFVDINMEGMYLSQDTNSHPIIVLSNQRPLPRRVFTCAHELGHHVFEHGSKIDGLTDEEFSSSEHEERLVDTFAAALLMPLTAIRAEFVKRQLDPTKASALHFYTISSVLGIGYQTLVTNCRINNLISTAREKELLKTTPGKLFHSVVTNGAKASHFKTLDQFAQVKVVDLEVSNYLVLPLPCSIEGDHLREFGQTTTGRVFIAEKPGVVRVTFVDQATFVRIQNLRYVGLVENRHLEN